MTGEWALIFVLALIVAAGIVVWCITPAWQCPQCHSDRVVEKDDVLTCGNCEHTWRAV